MISAHSRCGPISPSPRASAERVGERGRLSAAFALRPQFTPTQVEASVANFRFPGVSGSDRVDAATASSGRSVRAPLRVPEPVVS